MQLTIRIIIINTRTNDTYVSFATFFAFFSRAHFHYVSRYFQSLKTKNYFVFCFSSVNLNVNNVKSVCARNFFFLFCLFSFVFWFYDANIFGWFFFSRCCYAPFDICIRVNWSCSLIGECNILNRNSSSTLLFLLLNVHLEEIVRFCFNLPRKRLPLYFSNRYLALFTSRKVFCNLIILQCHWCDSRKWQFFWYFSVYSVFIIYVTIDAWSRWRKFSFTVFF